MHCLFAKPTTIKFKHFVFLIFVLVFFIFSWYFLRASTLVRAAMDSDDEIFLTQNTFSQEAFSPELNLEELLGDLREVSDQDSVEVEKKENPGCNIVVVCDNEVEKRRES